MFGAQGFSSACHGGAKSPSWGPLWTLFFGARFPQGPPGAPRGLPEALQGPPESAPRRPGSPQRIPKFGKVACIKPWKYVRLAPKDLQKVTFCDFGGPPGTSQAPPPFARTLPGPPQGRPRTPRGPPRTPRDPFRILVELFTTFKNSPGSSGSSPGPPKTPLGPPNALFRICLEIRRSRNNACSAVRVPCNRVPKTGGGGVSP